MRTITIATTTWREAIRQPVSLIILAIAAAATFLSQYIDLYHFDEGTGFNVIREMSVAQALMCGIVIAVFTASAVVAQEIENQTVLTLLAKPIRRYEVILGKFLGIMMAIAMAFVVMVAVSMFTVWWAESQIEKGRTNPCLVATELPALVTGQSTLQVGESYKELLSKPGGMGLDYFQSLGDFLLLGSGQTSQLVARVPLAAKVGRTEPGPGLASVVNDVLDLLSTRVGLLPEAFLLAFVHVMVIAAISVAVSTRLPLVFNALLCTSIFVLGNVSQQLGHMLSDATRGGGAVEAATWPVVQACYLVPNFENFNLTEALAVGIQSVPARVWIYGVLYGCVYTALALGVGGLLFQRREVT